MIRSLTSWCCLLLLAGSVSAGAKDSYVAHTKAVNVPLLTVAETNRVAVGDISACTITNHAFRIVNTGSVAVAVVRLIPLCKCITGAVSTNVVAPGKDAVVTMTIDPRTVAGAFERGMWVCTDDTDTPYVLLQLYGKVLPVFKGVPLDPVRMNLTQIGVPVTNRLSLSAAEKGLSLGTPSVVTNGGGWEVAAQVVADQEDSRKFDIAFVATATSAGNHTANVEVPVKGLDGASPLLFRLRASMGPALTVAPASIAIALASEPRDYRIVLRSRGPKLEADKLTWAALPAGVTVTALQGRRESELLIRLNVTPEAAEALYRDKQSAVQFTYPEVGDIRVPFVDESGETKEGSRRSLRHSAGPGGEGRRGRGFRF